MIETIDHSQQIPKKITDKVKILLVDDLDNNLLALEGLLRRDDLEICKAKSGAEALGLMLNADFALALIDVQMPGMNGFELAEFMRSTKKTKNIPIIFVTATASQQSFLFKGYESGAVDFLLKPLDSFAVKSKVNIFVEMYRQRKELKIQLDLNSELMADLNESKVAAERANSFKTQFLANMSHEIRTPLGAILGFLNLLKSPTCTSEEKSNYMLTIERNSQQLLGLVDDILDLSKVEAGKMTVESIQFSLAEMLSEFNSHMTFKAGGKGVEFKFNMDSPIPDIISSDPIRLRQILSNIAGNALKFTDKGYVSLSVSYADPLLRFTVKDTVIGISKGNVLVLFQPFTQANPTTTRKFGGTGLGLVLSRRLAEALGGKLEIAESREGFGSTFLIEVKSPLLSHAKLIGLNELSAIEHAVLPNFKKNKDILRGLKVLLVEDSPDNQTLITMYLNNAGAIVKLASDGAQGVESALSENFDVVLMDIQMPIMDGHEAVTKLRKSKYAKPIIALTAHAMTEERAKCFESGFTDFLTKPLQKSQLIEVLSRYIHSR